MIRSLCYSFLVLVVLAYSCTAHAQWGVEASYVTGPLSTVDRSPGSVNRFNVNGNGMSIEQSFAAGLAFERSLTASFGLNFGLDAELIQGSFNSDPSTSFDGSTTDRFGVSTNTIGAIMRAGVHYGSSRYRIGLGPAWRLTSSHSASISHSTTSVRGTVDSTFDVSSPALGRIMLEVEAGLALPLSRPTWLSGYVHFDPLLNRYLPFFQSLQTGVRLQVSLGGRAADTTVRGLSSSVARPQPSILLGATNIDSVQTLAVTTHYSAVQYYDELPLNTPDISAFRLLRQSETAAFDEHREDVRRNLEAEVLNVIGSRLKLLPAAELDIAGDSASVIFVGQYFRDVWGLKNPITLSIISPDPLGKHQGVTFSSNDRSLLLPLASRSIQRRVDIPKVVLERSDPGKYRLTILSERDTLLNAWSSSVESDRTVIEVPVSLDLTRPLTVEVAYDSNTVRRSIELTESAADTSAETIAIFRPIGRNHAAASNRDLLLERMGGLTARNCTAFGEIDPEAIALLQTVCGGVYERVSTGAVSRHWRVEVHASKPASIK